MVLVLLWVFLVIRNRCITNTVFAAWVGDTYQKLSKKCIFYHNKTINTLTFKISPSKWVLRLMVTTSRSKNNDDHRQINNLSTVVILTLARKSLGSQLILADSEIVSRLGFLPCACGPWSCRGQILTALLYCTCWSWNAILFFKVYGFQRYGHNLT